MDGDMALAERRERLDLRPGLILGVGLGTLALVAAVLGSVALFEAVAGGTGSAVVPPTRYAPPQLQSDPAGDLRDYQAAQKARLRGYSWVDREAGRVSIPIDRAMDMIVARGAAAYEPIDPPHWPDPRR